MRAIETRITILLAVSIAAVIGATYWMTIANGGGELTRQWMLIRGAGIIAGSTACLVMGIMAIVRDMQRHRQRVLEHARQWVLSPSRRGPSGTQGCDRAAVHSSAAGEDG